MTRLCTRVRVQYSYIEILHTCSCVALKLFLHGRPYPLRYRQLPMPTFKPTTCHNKLIPTHFSLHAQDSYIITVRGRQVLALCYFLITNALSYLTCIPLPLEPMTHIYGYCIQLDSSPSLVKYLKYSLSQQLASNSYSQSRNYCAAWTFDCERMRHGLARILSLQQLAVYDMISSSK